VGFLRAPERRGRHSDLTPSHPKQPRYYISHQPAFGGALLHLVNICRSASLFHSISSGNRAGYPATVVYATR